MTAPPPSSSPRFRELVAGRTPLLVALGAIVVGLCLLVVFAALLLRGGDVLEGEEPTPFPTNPGAATAEVIVGGIVSGTPISLSLNAPATLEIGAQTYAVRPEPVAADGSWDPELRDEQTAAWIYGTLINYVIGLADTSNNRDMLEGLAPGATVYLILRDGTRHGFAITGREFVPTNRVDLFAQNFPGLTLILLGARGDERLVVRGDYVVDTAAGGAPSGAGNQIELGQTAQLDNLRLSVTGAASLFDRPEAPPGFIFYLVDMQLDNAGTEPLDLSQLRFALRDDLGNQYALNPQASGLGTNPPPSGTLAPGESRTASLAYQLPSGLASPTVTLLISREGGTGEILVTLPFAGGGTDAALTGAVSLQQAEVSEDGTTLSLFGQVSNSGTQPLIVGEGDVSLVANGTVHLILSTNPAFPWTIAPGGTVPFTLSFQRPAASEAIFTLLSQPFQLTGLR
ncbi:MAG: DUF4352 domain-containing protein [Anaerolineae bacterium]|nr:DUF4352 domain-containing protein [Anaerolineae bacterium]